VSTLPPATGDGWRLQRSPTSPTPSGRLGRNALAVVLAGLLLVVGKAGPAQAHVVGIGGRASNYRTDVLDVASPTPGLTVRVLEAGNQLELTNHSDREVVVLGYRSEPYLRVGPAGVYENKRSPSAYANRFANAPSRIPADLDPAAPPQWRRIATNPNAVWHDHRSHWSGPDPPAVTADRGHRQVIVPNWQIPLQLGQRTALIEGDIVWVPGPSPWPWVLLALIAFGVVLVAGWRRQLVLLAPLVVVAVAADAIHTVGTLAPSTAPVLAKVYAAMASVSGWWRPSSLSGSCAVTDCRPAGSCCCWLARSWPSPAPSPTWVPWQAPSLPPPSTQPSAGSPSHSLSASGLAWLPPACSTNEPPAQPHDRAARPDSTHRTSRKVSGECRIRDRALDLLVQLAVGAGCGW
jgi:hypothetical protein